MQDGVDNVQQQQEAGDRAEHDARNDAWVRRVVEVAVRGRDGDEGGARLVLAGHERDGIGHGAERLGGREVDGRHGGECLGVAWYVMLRCGHDGGRGGAAHSRCPRRMAVPRSTRRSKQT